MPYRVDTVPTLLQPAVALYGYGLGVLLFALYVLQRLTITVRVEGGQNVVAGANYIFCHWHGSVPLSLQCSVPRLPAPLRHQPHVWMQHPMWYMKPIHVLLRLIGVKQLVLGSSGHDGRHAADELVDYLRRGYSTVLLPDGPHGPPRVLKKGILHIGQQSGVAIVPLRITATRCLAAKTWDRKQIPLPFSTVRVRIGHPIVVGRLTLDQLADRLCRALG